MLTNYESCRKIIGARYYYQGYAQDNGPPDATGAVYYSPRDDFGHGSHTASTAVGEEVNNVNLPGVSNLTAKGGAPHARLAVYKVCWHNSCSCADILKAYDDAISDGVDIITISITGNSKSNYFEDCFAIGAFHAYKNGILVSASAGNDGGYRTVANAAPWFLTVAASTIDREAYTFLRLGNGEVIRGYGLNLYQLEGYYPLVEASYCQINMLQYSVIRDTIVLCLVNGVDDSIDEKAEVLKEGGAVGMIVISNSNIIYNYAVPTAIPDITAPGVNILAAWLPNLETQAVDAVAYRFDSGTSMACPHATGVAAVVKAVRRTWSPAAIKSALMTTATLQDNTGGLIKSGQYQATPFDLGSGHLNPDLAVDPGLVYDFDIDDIIDFLCVQNANEWQLQNLVGRPVFCKTPPVAAYNLNYPSIGINYLDRPTSVYRTVTFKGKRNDPKTYKVSIEYPPGIKMRVVPDVLEFSDGSTKATYRVDFVPNGANGYVFGSITWSDGQEHNVRSPIAVNVV
ncbi:Subtilisin-like protease [Quillaja saponaria]|uniref:Subtilisin-like protease n=1 Tax=Quillaja saponaria TaxID=32244 RepID=A0AAD7PYM3_QUISA|nr:Subtilisin-like protease [Quillaja saponaria]